MNWIHDFPDTLAIVPELTAHSNATEFVRVGDNTGVGPSAGPRPVSRGLSDSCRVEDRLRVPVTRAQSQVLVRAQVHHA